MQNLTVDEWRERILAAWDRWGTGKPLDPRTVEHLAQEFAKPVRPLLDWHGKRPVLEFYPTPWPWDRMGVSQIRLDPTMPKDEIRLEGPHGIQRIINVGTGKAGE